MKLTRLRYKDLEQIPQIRINREFKQQFQGAAPAPFVGRHGYPKINLGLLSPQQMGDMTSYASPKAWSQQQYSIGQIASKRFSLVNSRTTHSIKKVHNNNKFLEICQEASMAKLKAATEVEILLRKRPQLQMHSDRDVKPFGPASSLAKARLTSNTKVHRQVEKVVGDTDLKAAKGLINLYKRGIEEAQLSKLLSVATLGIKRNRKLVPTRWSITATDDTLAKDLMQEVRRNTVQSEYQLQFGGSWGNYYLILRYPKVWSYELFEMYLSKSVNHWSKQGLAYSTDFESYQGRKDYAHETAGGYYAVKLPVLEKLQSQKRQAASLVLRFISDEYQVPLGVWVCREASRKAAASKVIHFSSQELMHSYAKELITKKFGFNIDLLLEKSKLLKNVESQKSLSEF